MENTGAEYGALQAARFAPLIPEHGWSLAETFFAAAFPAGVFLYLTAVVSLQRSDEALAHAPWPLGSTRVQGLPSAYGNRFMLRGSEPPSYLAGFLRLVPLRQPAPGSREPPPLLREALDSGSRRGGGR